ncbi:MAG: tagatose 1,6-diphosphate aldolase [Roseiflexaceae bacterium]|nr:tagatose 1,6-diphosphate aldolase [Roseiflexaceae bacterium]
MATVKMTRGKYERLLRCSDEHGVIAAAAMDQRGSLQKAIAKGRGEGGKAEASDLATFKAAVTKVLTRDSSAILMDPEYGLEAIKQREPGTGVLLAYEKTGYDVSTKGRLPDLLPEWSVKRLLDAGADAIKILLYYNPFDDESINTIKHAFVQRVGAECAANDAPFFLEPICYDDEIPDDKSLEFARAKPRYVKAYMAEFSKPEYFVDILKVEVPVNVKFVEGMKVYGGETAYTRDEAMALFVDAASVAKKPFIYLSAGVTDEVFRDTLELAAESGTPFSGVLCGRATWQDAIPIYASEGEAALTAWLEDRGLQNVAALNAVLVKGAKPWWDFYGGKASIEVVDLVVA